MTSKSRPPVKSMLKAFLLAAKKAYGSSLTSRCLGKLLFLSETGTTYKLVLECNIRKESLLIDYWIEIELPTLGQNL